MKHLLAIFVISLAANLRGETIQELVDAAKPGATIMVPPGIHRECVTLKAPITIIGEPGGEIRGSDVWTQWEPAGKCWKSTLTLPKFYHHGEGGQQSKWPEQVFVDDKELRHVASNPGAGEFSLDPQRHVLLGQSPDGATVEVTTRPAWFAINSDDVTIRNLRMKHAASDAQANAALSLNKQNGCVIDSCVMSDTHGCVVSLGSGKGSKLLNCEIFDGGATGIDAGGGYDGGSDYVISGNRIHDNDRSDFDVGWDAGGIKVCAVTNTVFENNEIWNNRGPGLWCDVDCGNIAIRGNRIHHNGGAGIQFEISRGAHITGNVVWDNGRAFSEWGWGAGILISSSRDCEIDSNLVAWNSDGISVISQNRGQERWNQVVNDDVRNNVIIGTDADPRDPKHYNIYTIAFLQDWKGVMEAPNSNNHAENNRICLPGPDRGGRFAFVAQMPSLDAFNASPGGKANRYITQGEAQALLKAAGAPLESEQ